MSTRLLDRIRERPLSFTHTPQATLAHGTWEFDGVTYRLTRVKRVGPTVLYRGGTAPCWRLYGVPLSEERHDG